MSFAVGQRWISHADSELGLGIVVDHDPRRVTLHFPAVAEDRTYAVANAPLTRLRLRPGDRLATRDGNVHIVAGVHEQHELLVYETAAGGEQIAELDIDDRIDLSTPRQRLLASQFDSGAAFALRFETCRHLDDLESSGLRGLLGTRTALLPHQLYIASEVGRRHAPRVLLADEVGLGKTIEAGMILHRQLLIGAAQRVLIVVPDTLQFQWLVEMRRRFNLAFALVDEERLRDGGEDNAFSADQLVLCPSGVFTDREHCRAALAAGWDLVVVDEAHRLPLQGDPAGAETREGDSGGATVVPGFLEALSECSAGLLLLTATPEQVGLRAHFERLALLDPERFHDFDSFVAEEREYRRWSRMLEVLEQGRVPDDLPEDIDRSASPDAQIAALIDRYGTGRVLFRNSRAAVGGFPERVLHRHPLPSPGGEAFASLFPDAHLSPSAWLEADPRVGWLVGHLRALRPAKVLVICAAAKTARALEEHLQLRAGIRAAAFHEELDLIERDRAAAYFAEQEQGAQALICSEIGGEGRNFQFAQHLVLFDLPRHPDQLEQRIGRLDRIGQQGKVQIHAPFIEGGAQETLLRWYDEGMGLFAKSCSAGDMVYARFRERLDAQLDTRTPAFDQLIDETAAFTAQARRELSEGRDRLLERSSCHRETGEALARSIAELENPDVLARYLESLCDVAGVEHDEHSPHTFILRPGEQEALAVFPELPEEGITVTVDRQRALTREDFLFLAWEHPWLEGAMETVLGDTLGQTNVASLALKGVPTGSRLYEFLFVVRISAPRALGVNRYLPLSPTRLLVDASGRDLGSLLSHDALNARVESLPRGTAGKVVRQLRAEIDTRSDAAEQHAGRLLEEKKQAAIQRYTEHLQEELDRLRALRECNPAIRADEIESLEDRLVAGREALDAAQISLQGLRLVVTR